MTTLRTAAQQALEALEKIAFAGMSPSPEMIDVKEAFHARQAWRFISIAANASEPLKEALAEPCPCGDRPAAQCPGEWEPGCDLGNNPKYAKRFNLAEPVQEPKEKPVAWRWGYRSITTGEMDWRGYVEIAAHPNLRSPEIIMEPLYAAPPQHHGIKE